MAAIRIRGIWYLSLTVQADNVKSTPLRAGDAQLAIHKASRAGIAGELQIGGETVIVIGRVKPGSPAVVTLAEVDAEGSPVQDGVEAILYIPPWWPTVKYQYDLITGTMIIGTSSSVKRRELAHKIILVSGIQPFE